MKDNDEIKKSSKGKGDGTIDCVMSETLELSISYIKHSVLMKMSRHILGYSLLEWMCRALEKQ